MTQTPHCRTEKTNKITKNIFIAILAGAGFLASCTQRPAVLEGTKTSTAENLALGKTTYENSCVRCHELPNPTAHSPQDWVGIMNSMAPKAKLTDEQHALVYDYVVSVKNQF